METERGTEVTLPTNNKTTNLSNGDNILVTFKMDIAKVKTFDDITVISVTKL